MIATETARTAVLVLLGLSIVWVVILIIKNDMSTIIRALIVTAVLGLSFFYLSQTKLEELSFRAVKNDLFPPRQEHFTWEKRETITGGIPTTLFVFSEPGPRLALDLERGGKYLTINDVDSLNSVLRTVGLPPVKHGVRELAAISGRTLDANIYRWEDYELGILTIERGLCRNMTTTETFPCISSITVRGR